MNKKSLVLICISCLTSLHAMEQSETGKPQVEEAQVTLVDAEGSEYTISKKAAMKAQFLKSVLEEAYDEEPIPLHISSKAMLRLIKRLKLYSEQKDDERKIIPVKIKRSLHALPLPVLLEDAQVADYVGAEELLKAIAHEIAYKMIARAEAQVESITALSDELIQYLYMIGNMHVRFLISEEYINYLKRHVPWAVEAEFNGPIIHNFLAYSPDGARFIVKDGVSVKVYDTRTRQLLADIPVHREDISGAALSHDGKKIAIGFRNGQVHIWNIDTREFINEIQQGMQWVRNIAWSPDDTKIIIESLDGTLRIWNVLNLQLIADLREGHATMVSSIGWSPDGKQIVTASWDGNVVIWDGATQRLMKRFHADHPGNLIAEFSPDGTMLITACSRSYVRLWDALTFQQIGEPIRPTQIASYNVKSVRLSPDNTHLILRSIREGISNITYIMHQPLVKYFQDKLEEAQRYGC